MKYLEIHKLSTEELEQKIAEETETLRKHKFAHSISPIDNPTVILKTRRLIAQMKTNLRQRDLELIEGTDNIKTDIANDNKKS